MHALSKLRIASLSIAVLVLSACSGAKTDADPDFVAPPAPPPTTGVVTTPAAVRVLFSAGSLDTQADNTTSGVTVRAVVTDTGNAAIRGASVSFSTDSGVIIVSNTQTDESGAATAILTTGGDPTPRTITVTAKSGAATSKAIIPVQAAGPTTSPSLSTLRLVSDRQSIAPTDDTPSEGTVLSAIATDSQGRLLAGVPITFSVPTGNGAVSVTSSTTDSNGTALATLTTGGDTTIRTITVRAASGSISGQADVQVSTSANPASSVATLSLAKSRDTLSPSDNSFANGVTISAQAVNSSGQVVTDAPISFAIASGGGAIKANASSTDDAGQASAILHNGNDGTARSIVVTVTSGAKTSTIQIPVSGSTPSSVGRIVISTDRAALNTQDSTTSRALTVFAQATDSTGNVLPGVTVNFAITAGGGAIQSVNAGVTGDDGIASARLTTGGDTTVRTITVSAASGSQTANVNIPVQSGTSASDAVAGLVLSKNRTSLNTTDASADQGVGIAATVSDSGGRTITGAPVDFQITTGNGVITIDSTNTDSTGRAHARVSTGGNTTPRTITVRASSGSRSATIDVPVVQQGTANDQVRRIAVSLDRTNLFSDEDTLQEALTVTAQLLDAGGASIGNSSAAFTISSGGGALSVANGGLADDSGVVTALLHTGGDPAARTIVVNVISGNTTGSVNVPVSPRSVSQAVSRIVISPNPIGLFDDQTTSDNGKRFSAQLLDSNGVAVSGASVTYAVDAGAAGLVPETSVSDGSGIVSAILTTAGDPTPRSFGLRVNSGSTTGSATVTVSARAATLTLLSSSPSLPSAADTTAEGVQITATVTDSSGNRVANSPVTFSASSGAIVAPESTTDATGIARATLVTNGDATPRNITVTATASAKTTTITIPVVGTRLIVTSPGNQGSGDSATISTSLVDSDGMPIPGKTVTLTSALGNSISPASVTTNASGVAAFTYTATTGGNETVTVAGFGTSAAASFTVSTFKLFTSAPSAATEVNLGNNVTVTFNLTSNGAPSSGQALSVSTTRGTLNLSTITTDASGMASVILTAPANGSAGAAVVTATGPDSVRFSLPLEFVATTPATITVQSDRTSLPTNETAAIQAIIRDANNNPVKNQTVAFSLNDSSGGSIDRSSAVTDFAGTARLTYTAGTTNSGLNGVVITATNGPRSANARLTVGGQSARITLGTGNDIQEGGDGTLFTLPYSALVTDNAGNPIPNASVTLKLNSVAYQKGTIQDVDTDADGVADAKRVFYNATAQSPSSFGCLNEDANLDGVQQTGEDFNANSMLDPGNVASIPNAVTTGPDGAGTFRITYAQQFNVWVQVRLTATVQVSGTESQTSQTFTLPGLADDFQPGVATPGSISPFGTSSSCSNPN